MKGTLDLFLSILLFSLQFVFAKLYQKKLDDGIASQMAFVTISSLSGALLALPFCRYSGRFDPLSLLFAVLFGLSAAACDIFQLKAMRRGSAAVTTMFIMIGSIFLPFLFGVCFLDEKLGVFKITALVLLCFIFLPEAFSLRKGGRIGLLFLLCCLVCFFANGVVSIFSKMQADLPGALSTNDFMLCAYLACAAFTAVFLFAGRRGPVQMKRSLTPGLLLPAVCYSGCNFAGNVFSLRAAGLMPSSVQFPVSSGCIVVVSALLYFLIFREKQSAFHIVCMAVSLLSIFFFSL